LIAFEAAQDPNTQPLSWDERYESFIRRAEFLPLAWLITQGLPLMDVVALMAFGGVRRPTCSYNEVVDEYDEMTRQDTVQLEHGPFQNYVISIFFVHPLYSSFEIEVHTCHYCPTVDSA
jgi:hypothetical protein